MALLRAESADLEPRLRQGHHITSNGRSFAALLFIGTCSSGSCYLSMESYVC